MHFPLESIAPGEFSIQLSLVGSDPRGSSIYYDMLEDVGHFVVVDDPSRTAGFVWTESLWGNMRPVSYTHLLLRHEHAVEQRTRSV